MIGAIAAALVLAVEIKRNKLQGANTMGLKKLFVSQPMLGLTEARVKAQREDALRMLKEECGPFQETDNILLAEAALLVGNWKKSRVCWLRRVLLAKLGVPCYEYR